MHCVHILFYLQALKVKNKSRSERTDFIYFYKAALWQYPLIKTLNCTNKAGLNYTILALLKWTFSWYFYDSTPYHRMHLDIQCFQECDNEFASVTWTVSGSQRNQVSLGWGSMSFSPPTAHFTAQCSQHVVESKPRQIYATNHRTCDILLE